VLRFAIPAGIATAGATFAVYVWGRARDDMSLTQERTSATITLLSAALVILVLVSRPLALWKLALAIAMGVFYTIVLLAEPLRKFFDLDLPPATFAPVIAAGAAAAALGIVFLPRILPWGSDVD
jgi:cation-transporting ATPase E